MVAWADPHALRVETVEDTDAAVVIRVEYEATPSENRPQRRSPYQMFSHGIH